MTASIVRSDHKRKLPKNLSSAQAALSDTEEGGQSRPERCKKKKVQFFLPCEHVKSRSDKRDIICEGYSTESGIPLIAVAGNKRPHTHFAYLQPQMTMKLSLKAVLITMATLVVLGLATGLGVKLGGTNSEEIEVVEPGADIHQGTEFFNFSNTKIAGSTTLLILAIIAAISYFCKHRIVSKLSRNQAPFVPTSPASPAPAVGYSPAIRLAQLPDIMQHQPQPYRGQLQDFCSFPVQTSPFHIPAHPSFQPPSGKVPSSGDLERLRLGLRQPPSYYPTAPVPSYTEAADMEKAMRNLDDNAARIAKAQSTK